MRWVSLVVRVAAVATSFGASWLSASVVQAAGPTEASEFSPFYEELLLGLEDAATDTGWIPANSPVQMRLFADAANSVTIDMPGVAYYDWETEQLRFEGDPMAGLFEYDVGLELVASVKVDVSLVQWQSDLLGPYDWGVEVSELFTPYLLEGNPARPVTLTDKSGALDLVSIPLTPDIVILSGTLDIALFVDIEASLSCDRIEVLGTDGELSVFTLEGESQWIDPGQGPDDVLLPASLFCQLQTQPTLIVYPHLVVEVLFDEYDIAGIEIPIDLPVIDEEVALDTIDLRFPYWQAEPGGDEAGESGDDGGLDETGGETGTGGDALAGLGDDGCNCSTATPVGGYGASAIGLLSLLGLRRREARARTRGN